MEAPTLNHHPQPNHKDVWFLILMFIICAVLIAVLNSCTCDYHLRKAKSKCGYSLKTDTIYRNDTTFVNRVQKDKVFNFYSRDTVVVKEGRLTMKYFYNTHDSTVYLKGQCDTIRIIKEIPVQVNTTEIKESYLSYFKWAALILVLVITLYILSKVTIRKI